MEDLIVSPDISDCQLNSREGDDTVPRWGLHRIAGHAVKVLRCER